MIMMVMEENPKFFGGGSSRRVIVCPVAMFAREQHDHVVALP